MEAVLCGGPYILVPGTRAGGGWEWRGSTKGREVWGGGRGDVGAGGGGLHCRGVSQSPGRT